MGGPLAARGRRPRTRRPRADTPGARCVRASWRGAALAGLLALGLAGPRLAPAQEPGGPELPRAAFVSKVAWSTSPGLTRVRFQADRPVVPAVERVAADVLRLDLVAVGARDTPRSLRVGSPEVRSITRVPRRVAGGLPEGVSERFLVHLADTSAVWSVRESAEGFTLLVGVPEKAAPSATMVAGPDPWAPGAELAGAEAPRPAERLSPAVPFVVAAEQPVRASPSALSPGVARVLPGDARIADARRGPWVHLVSGGWLLHALPEASETPPAAPPSPGPRVVAVDRTPAEWSVVILGTGLSVRARELTGEESAVAAAATALLAAPVQLVRLELRARGPSQYGFRLPPKAGRLVFGWSDGRRVESLDPRQLPRRAGVTEEEVGAAFPTADVPSGAAWNGLLPLPVDAVVVTAEQAWIDVDGRLHRLFRLPGSGEPVGE